MTKERLYELNKLQRQIENREEALNILKKFREKKVVITDYIDKSMRIPSMLQEAYNNGSLRIPDELKNVLLTLLEDYYTRKLNELKEEFKEG